jgi:hypothetical protein
MEEVLRELVEAAGAVLAADHTLIWREGRVEVASCNPADMPKAGTIELFLLAADYLRLATAVGHALAVLERAKDGRRGEVGGAGGSQ